LESLQASETSRRLPLPPLRRSLLRERRFLGRRQLLSLLKKLCVLNIKRRIILKILLEEEVAEEVKEEEILEAGVADSFK
ncbi:hypothetical protein, partial [Actinobacillus pleuropneumoniae]|uniref:hypothetical protein n=1 Tax=Actinobacillus pleuropneumoniae TaxID=715 RepID=UPI00227C3B43